MRTISYAALALAAGLALSGAAQADEYISAANRAQYAVSAQGFLPQVKAQAQAKAPAQRANETLLPAAARPMAGTTARATARATVIPVQNAGPTVSPFAAENPHWGPAPDGSLPMR
ncbi:hypothetical protein [Azorhizobium doebereinerae]|uniref:hypothetical protein n=1 Tax=Azorhizobium doebereinerae TaxID=281091 RepID=UPI00040F6ED2|nr:hypothetical protein [Azorhizobium doebereinerae]